MQKPFTLSPEMAAEIDNELDQRSPVAELRKLAAQPIPETEHSAFHVLNRGSLERTLITFVEIEGYPILRVSTGGNSQDLVLNSDQVKLLLRQMTLWLTR